MATASIFLAMTVCVILCLIGLQNLSVNMFKNNCYKCSKTKNLFYNYEVDY